MTTPSESSPTPDAKPNAKADPTPAKDVSTKRTRREKWRRRFFVLVTTLALISLLVRAAAHAIFPIVLDRIAGTYGLHADYDKLDLSVLGGDVGIWGLRFTPVDGGKPVVTSAYCRGAISTLALAQFK